MLPEGTSPHGTWWGELVGRGGGHGTGQTPTCNSLPGQLRQCIHCLLLLRAGLSQRVHYLQDCKFLKKASEEGRVLPLKLLFPLLMSSQ